ncbi:hypothetical protein B0H16DRAFT_1247244, partial [Mycena metata]
PKWAREARASLRNGTEEWGEDWCKVIGLWWALEKSTRFSSSNKAFPATGRPEEVKNWVKCARKGTPTMKKPEEFASAWEGWWKAINPEWRVAADGTLKQSGEGEWSTMEVPGVNGFLSVLMCLRWWKEGGVNGDWTACVADVTWVLER